MNRPRAANPGPSPRRAALAALLQVVQHGRNLPDALEPELARIRDSRDRALAQALAYGVMRDYWRLDALLGALLEKPLRAKDADVQLVLMLGLYQIMAMRIPDHAAVTETVKLLKKLKKPWAKGLVNGVLRHYLRQQETVLGQLQAKPAFASGHPDWLVELFRRDWPDDWRRICEANNQPPPMTLRVNPRQISRQAYLQKLQDAGFPAQPARHAKSALTLDKPVDVSELPGFAQGWVSVQDSAAQLAAPLLDPQPGERVLDACAAPGGKTAHLRERQPELAELVALDIEASRLARVEQALARLQLEATCLAGDAADPASWWDGQPFDRILLDAPCSATGVIRRHPDIRLLRRQSDIAPLVVRQQAILQALWTTLKPGGFLLYATCSILKQENTQQIVQFLDRHDDARLLDIEADWGQAMPAGRQILPGDDNMDGFFYARLQKN